MFSLSLIYCTLILSAHAANPNPYLVEYPSFLNVLPEPFERPNIIANLFYQTTLPIDAPPEYVAAYTQLHNASFISFDPRFATDVIGSAGPVEKVADLPQESQEMPMYLKDEGVIFWSSDNNQFRTIDVKTDTSTHGGIWTLDYKTGNATMILNNQLGLSIGADDMPTTEEAFSSPIHQAGFWLPTGRCNPPASLYYLHLSTMSLIDVDPTLVGPNGVVISADGTELYATDQGDNFNPPNNIMAQVLTLGKAGRTVYVNSAGPRTIYAYTLSPTTGLPTARRTLAVADAGYFDGMKVTSSGLIFAAVYGGVDVYDRDGARLGKINIPSASPNGQLAQKHVVNLVFEENNLWCFAYGGIYRVRGLLVEGDPRLR
ncbi:Gluconolactonase [Mycena venus]|uniref:Gluconolactonase n=1 Tax=Mycena venus TaxID=2733690 RepID=A0A8H6YL72_9AGAR|nr:Gluconolactonase [Mycena venus]